MVHRPLGHDWLILGDLNPIRATSIGVDIASSSVVLKEGSMELLGPWRIIFVVFVTYSMLPLSLRWCLICGSISSVAHIIIVVSFTLTEDRNLEFAKKVSSSRILI
ncbi:uncharacterized protein NPIL_292101 [Nephila pilipes]|uniref:Uncharacterized protein n=1 Tax=Nephila pilipes TaxID=299642 RepID=A0A8X6QJI5_NEPPI|nr:uncharacterized protein NPIL_292101 [Nephila pilipes]